MSEESVTPDPSTNSHFNPRTEFLKDKRAGLFDRPLPMLEHEDHVFCGFADIRQGLVHIGIGLSDVTRAQLGNLMCPRLPRIAELERREILDTARFEKFLRDYA